MNPYVVFKEKLTLLQAAYLDAPDKLRAKMEAWVGELAQDVIDTMPIEPPKEEKEKTWTYNEWRNRPQKP